MHLARPAFRKLESTLKAGFTLIELLAVILIIGILMTFLLPRIPEAIDHAKVTACRKNMQEIYNGLNLYYAKFNRAPNQSGVKFFAMLIDKGCFDNTDAVVKKLTCPGVDIGVLELNNIPDPKQWFVPLDKVDGRYSSYAGRNCKEFPLRSWPPGSDEVLVSDDNDPSMNHRTSTVYLLGDGSAATFELKDDKIRALLGPDVNVLVVGKDSPVPELRKLSLD